MTLQADLLNSLGDPNLLDISGQDVRGATLILPLDAPIPSELADVPASTGTLLNRLSALDDEALPEGEDFRIVLLRGSELLALDRAWSMLVRTKKLYVVFDIPGATYDVLFTQGVRTLGLRRLGWGDIAEELSKRVRTVQRTKDASPFLLSQSLTGATNDDIPTEAHPVATAGTRRKVGPVRAAPPPEPTPDSDIDVDA